MNQDQTLGLIRTLCTMAGTALGYSATQTSQLTAAMLGLGSFIFFAVSIYGTYRANSTKSKIASTATIPSTTIVTTPELANSIPASNVVSNANSKVVSK